MPGTGSKAVDDGDGRGPVATADVLLLLPLVFFLLLLLLLVLVLVLPVELLSLSGGSRVRLCNALSTRRGLRSKSGARASSASLSQLNVCITAAAAGRLEPAPLLLGNGWAAAVTALERALGKTLTCEQRLGRCMKLKGGAVHKARWLKPYMEIESGPKTGSQPCAGLAMPPACKRFAWDDGPLLLWLHAWKCMPIACVASLVGLLRLPRRHDVSAGGSDPWCACSERCA